MSIQQNQIVQPTYNGQDIYYRTPVDAIITDGMSLDDYIRNTTGVVESGSNSNGSYIKFADGTLIQQGNTGTFSVPASQSGFKAVTFPINFFDTDYYVVQTELDGGAYWSWVNVSTQNKTISGFNCSCWNNTSASAANVGYSWIAIGRWKDYDTSVLPDQQQSTIINSSSTNYYDDERVVGIWIDGKPIYRKVITTTVNASGSISTGISHMDWLVRAMGTALMKDGNIFLPLNFYNEATGWNSFHVSGHGSAIQYQRGTSYEVQRTYFILEYTKTTDSPITSQTKDLLTVVNGKNITDLETIIQQRIDQLLENKLKEKLQQLK